MFDFKGLDSSMPYADNIAYASSRLERISSGSTRHCFALDSERVIKVAVNETGIIQNNVEKHYSQTNWQRLARCMEHDNDFMWIVCERTVPIEEKDFENLLGISVSDLYVHLYHKAMNIFGSETKPGEPVSDYMLDILERKKITAEIPIVKELLGKQEEFGFSMSDLSIVGNWGIRKTENGDYAVISDYGNFDNRFRKFPLRNPD